MKIDCGTIIITNNPSHWMEQPKPPEVKKMKYYYGLKDQEMYMSTDLGGAWKEIDDEYGNDCIGMEIIEMKVSRKYGNRHCQYIGEFLESDSCGKYNCEYYQPKNKISGICIHSTYGLHETGRKWAIKADGKLKKISGRKKK